MKRTHLAIGIVGIAITLAAEIPACHRIIFRAVPHHHSKTTLASWAEWNKTHVPPKPKEILAELDLACPPVNLAAIDTGDFIPAEVAPAWEPIEFEPDVTVATLGASTVGLDYTVPSDFVLVYPTYFGITFQPGTYIVPQPVPEPWTIGLVMAGAACLYFRKLEVPSE